MHDVYIGIICIYKNNIYKWLNLYLSKVLYYCYSYTGTPDDITNTTMICRYANHK